MALRFLEILRQAPTVAAFLVAGAGEEKCNSNTYDHLSSNHPCLDVLRGELVFPQRRHSVSSSASRKVSHAARPWAVIVGFERLPGVVTRSTS